MQDFPLREITCNKKRFLYGVIDGYAVSVSNLRSNSGEFQFETAATNGFGNLRDVLMRNKFSGFSVITGALGNDYVQFTIKFSAAAGAADWERAITEILEIARKFWYVPYDRCVICHKRRTDTLGLHRGCYRHLHRDCIEKSVERATLRAKGDSGAKPFIGAVGGALIVLVLNLIVYFVTKVTFPMIYAFTPFLAWYGFQLLHGTNNKKSAWFMIVISLILPIASELLTAAVSSGIPAYFNSLIPILLSYAFTAVGILLASFRMFYGSEKIVADKRMVLETLVEIPIDESDDVTIEIVD